MTGKPFDAEDVKFTFDRLMDPKTGTAHPEYYKDIDSVQVVDSHTVKIKLKNVNSMFLFNLARPDSIIVNKQTVDKIEECTYWDRSIQVRGMGSRGSCDSDQI